MRKASIAAAAVFFMFFLGAAFHGKTAVELPDMLVPASAEAESPALIERLAAAKIQKIGTMANTAMDQTSKKVVKRLDTVTVTTGSALNTSAGMVYDINLSGEDAFVIPLYVNQAGMFNFSVKEKGTKNTKMLHISVYKDKECKNLIRSFTLDRGKAAKMIGRVPLPKKGNYYLEFQADALQKTETTTFLFTSSFIQGGDRTLLNNETAYTGTSSKKPIYYKIALDKDAVLAVKVKEYLTQGKIYASLCDRDKNKILAGPVLLSEEAVYYPAEKGTYLIEIQTDAENIFTMSTMTIPVSDKSGYGKETACLLMESKLETGMFPVSDKKILEKWYQLKLKKPQKVEIDFIGGVSSFGAVRIEFFDANGKRFGERTLTKRNEDLSFRPSVTYKGKDAKKSGYLPEGTYYIKITNTEKEASGYYSLQYRIQQDSKK